VGVVTFSVLGHLGRLGNQLFQIAATIGTAEKHDFDYIFPVWDCADCFVTPIPQVENLMDGGFYWVYHESSNYREVCYQPIELASDEAVDLRGYFQSEKYFEHCADKIRKLFTLNRATAKFVAQESGDVSDMCSLHVRRDDYLDLTNFFVPLGRDYYDAAMARFDDDTRFLVFSDDIEWCKKEFTGPRFSFSEGHTPLVDMFTMASCKGHIIANSSFSWWGAWLNSDPDKLVIAPREWIVNRSSREMGRVPDAWHCV
jgi:hypothetical protein